MSTLQFLEITREVKVNSRGSRIIPKRLIEAEGRKVGDKFEVKKSKAGMSFKRV